VVGRKAERTKLKLMWSLRSIILLLISFLSLVGNECEVCRDYDSVELQCTSGGLMKICRACSLTARQAVFRPLVQQQAVRFLGDDAQ